MSLDYKPKISIIFPIYNVEQYIGPSILSIQNQTFQEWELIAVDDGSLDNSLPILEKFAQNDARIKIVRKQNGGASSARNIGLEHAMADYISFVDSDDLIPNYAYKLLYEEAQKNDYDIIIGQQYLTYSNKFDLASLTEAQKITIPNYYKNRVLLWEDFDFIHYYDGVWFASPCSKLYKKALWNKVRFHEELHMAEDLLAIKEVALIARRIGIIPNYVYIYKKRPNSITTKRSNYAFDVFTSVSLLIKLFKNQNLYETHKQDLQKYFFELYICHMLACSPLSFWLKFLKQIRAEVQNWDMFTIDNPNEPISRAMLACNKIKNSSDTQLTIIVFGYYIKYFANKIIANSSALIKKFAPYIIRKLIYNILRIAITVLTRLRDNIL